MDSKMSFLLINFGCIEHIIWHRGKNTTKLLKLQNWQEHVRAFDFVGHQNYVFLQSYFGCLCWAFSLHSPWLQGTLILGWVKPLLWSFIFLLWGCFVMCIGLPGANMTIWPLLLPSTHRSQAKGQLKSIFLMSYLQSLKTSAVFPFTVPITALITDQKVLCAQIELKFMSWFRCFQGTGFLNPIKYIYTRARDSKNCFWDFSDHIKLKVLLHLLQFLVSLWEMSWAIWLPKMRNL